MQRTISGLAPGIENTDAVNVGQLDDAAKISNRGIAGVSAMAGLPPIDDGKKFSVGLGVGYYENETAIAFGAQARVADQFNFKLSVATSKGDYVSSVGLGYSF
jgi:autotransporter adhesin